eukprot:GDKJ01044576.1.p1 GENE.GDKJ01044576.1~~GDKJ01044576.1.p1  ORF type:complete len:109 (+),score=9.47 GDKJ01044576.1:30-356(+)
MERTEEYLEKYDPILLKARTARFRMDSQDRPWLLPTASMFTHSWFNFNMTELEFKEFIIKQLELRLERECRRKISKTDAKTTKVPTNDLKKAIIAVRSVVKKIQGEAK